MLRKLRFQFVTVIMVIVTVMLCLVFGMLYHFTKESMESESIRMMESIASNPFQLGRPDESSSEVRLPYFVLQIGNNGEILTARSGYFDLSDEEFLEALIQVAFETSDQAGIIAEYNLRFCRVATPAGQSIVFADITSELSTLRSLARNGILLGAVCLLVFLGVSILLAVWIVKPVETAWKQQRQFVADASHELKTPLTVIMTNAELLQSPDYDEESRTQFAGSILTMSRQMRALVERLLDLARAGNEPSQAARSTLDFGALTEQALLPFEPVFFEKSLTLSSQLQDGVLVSGSEQQLQQVLDILLDNAQKYSLQPGFVEVRLQKTGKRHCRLSVSTPGEDISKEDLKNIFKRFYRVDKGRSRDGSFGLGLSIAEAIVQSHHGRIWAESQNGVNTFHVELPIILEPHKKLSSFL